MCRCAMHDRLTFCLLQQLSILSFKLLVFLAEGGCLVCKFLVDCGELLALGLECLVLLLQRLVQLFVESEFLSPLDVTQTTVIK